MGQAARPTVPLQGGSLSNGAIIAITVGCIIACCLIGFMGISALGALATPGGGTTTSSQPNVYVAPTQTRAPTATPTPLPTATDVPPTATTPPCTTLNCNPWGYSFSGSNLIYDPPGAFCSYFDCIANFWNGNGYVVECADDRYSKSGGIQGACSQHGGVLRPLYAP